ncbi:unnamed protein product [Peronospora destructor]|uniref:DNA topoisomerase (ATP-hydrolyzing) n=1 Tax=Peronospora destructor TaxID=86335 RepID=A0AAV0VAE4_9STRA|nr:unnamed protein product [Peronospora destructor]
MATGRRQEEATAAGWSREEVLHHIELLAAEFLECLSDGKVLHLEALKRSSSAMIYDHEKQQQFHGNETRLIRLGRHGGRRYTGIWLILQTAHALLTENKTATQRDVYYLHPFFKGQSEADEAILDTGRFFTGDISILKDGQWRHFSSGEEVSITQELLQLKPSEIEDKFFETIPSILVTGRGFPDLATRMFVSLLSRVFELPVFGLCDCNPFGLSIMLTYKLGSARMPLESLQYAVDIKWVGFRPSQAARLSLPSSSLKALSRKDIAVADSLLRTSFVQANDAYKEEVEMWLGDLLPWKIELEALHFVGFTFLTTFLQECIKKGNFL